ncbi:MAG: hypothetical protein AAGK09_01025 [Planctomycetota bacterium]
MFGATGMVIGYSSIQDRFLSAGQVQMHPVLPTVMWDLREKGLPPMFRDLLATQPEIIEGPAVASRAVDDPEWVQATSRHGMALTVEEFQESVTAKQVTSGSYLFVVRFEADHPDLAAAGVNATLRAYAEAAENTGSNKEEQVTLILEQTRQQALSAIERLEAQIGEITGPLGVSGLRHRHDTKMLALDNLDVDLAELNRRDPTSTELDTEDTAMVELRTIQRGLQMELQRELAAGKMENHASVRQLRSQLYDLDRMIGQQRQAYAAPENGVGQGSGRDAERDRLMAQREVVSEEVAAMTHRLTEVDRLTRQLDQAQRRLAESSHELEKRNIESTVTGRIEIIGFGVSPDGPSNLGKRLQLAIAGGGLMGLLGLALTVGSSLISQRINSGHDAELELPGLPMLAALPAIGNGLDNAAVAGLRVHQLRSHLHITDGGEGCQIIAASSPAPGSGKTSVISALGVAFATSGSRTLIVDADLVGGALTAAYGVTPRPTAERLLREAGLIDEEALAVAINSASQSGMRLVDWLVEQGRLNETQRNAILHRQKEIALGITDVGPDIPLSECVGPAGVPNLSVLPQAANSLGHANTLSPALIKRIIEQARLEFDVVLFDTGPAGSSVEATLVASLAERTLLIIGRGDHRRAVITARSRLQAADARLEGFVFNRAQLAERPELSSLRSVSRRADMQKLPVEVDPSDVRRYGPLAAAVLATSSERLALGSLDASLDPTVPAAHTA